MKSYRLVLTALMIAQALAPVAAAQTAGFAPLRADGNGVPSLTRTIALDLRDVPLADVIRAIMREAQLDLVFRADLRGLDRLVTIREARITAAAALLRLLPGSGLRSVVSPGGQVVLLEAEDRRGRAGELVGVVREAGTGSPVAQVEVIVAGGGTAWTDAAGRFRLGAVMPGETVVSARRLGYHDLTRTVAVAPDGRTQLVLQLQPAPTPLAAVIVTPGHFGMLEQGVGSRQSLTRSEIEARPQLGDDIFRAVNRLPGVSSYDMSAAFSVRGGDHRELLLRLDGLELIEPFHLKDFEGGVSIIDVGSVGGVDLITGGFGAEYGNRLTGVFDMRTLAVPPGGARTSLGLSITNVRAASQGAFDADRGRWLFTARRGYLDLALRLGNGNTAISPRYYDVLGKVEYELAPRTLLSAHVLHAGDRLDYRDEINDPELRSDYGSSYAWLNLEARPHDRASVFTVLSAGHLGWQRLGVRGSDPRGRWTALEVDDDRSYRFAGLRQDWSLELGEDLLLKSGSDVRRASADYAYLSWQERFTAMDGSLHVGLDTTRAAAAPEGTSFGAYIAQRMRPWRPLTLELGAEYARHSHTDDSNVNPRVNASFALGRTTLRAAWGRYAQAQGLHELQVQDGVDEFFPAEHAEQRIASIEHAFPRGLDARLEAYERRLRDPRRRFANLDYMDDIFPELGGGRVLIDPERGRARGLELIARRAGGRFDWAASYALSRTEEVVGGEWKPAPRDQRHAIAIDLSWAPNPRWRLAAAGQFHSGWPRTRQLVRADSLQNGFLFSRYYDDYNAERLPTYHRMDVRVSRRFDTRRGHVSVFIDVWNVYNRTNARSIFTNVYGVVDGRPLTAEVEDGMIPRLPSFGVNWEF